MKITFNKLPIKTLIVTTALAGAAILIKVLFFKKGDDLVDDI